MGFVLDLTVFYSVVAHVCLMGVVIVYLFMNYPYFFFFSDYTWRFLCAYFWAYVYCCSSSASVKGAGRDGYQTWSINYGTRLDLLAWVWQTLPRQPVRC